MLLRRSHIIRAGISTGLLAGVYLVLNHNLNGQFWAGMPLSNAYVLQEYCEHNHWEAFFHQTMNSYSNLCFFFFGMVLLLTGISDHREKYSRNILTRFPAISVIFGCCMIYLCFGSTFFHASLTWTGQRFDMNGTYSVSIILLLLSVYRFVYTEENKARIQRNIIVSFFVLVFAFIYLHLVIPSYFLLPAIMLGVVILAILNSIRYTSFDLKYAFVSLTCLLGAFAFRQQDVSKTWCNPDSLCQGHSAWHLLTGASPFFMYLFYRSERKIAER